MNQFDEVKLEKFYDGKLIKKLSKYTKGLWLLLIFSALMLLAGTLFDLLQPKIISSIIDDYLVPKETYLVEKEEGIELQGKTYAISKSPTDTLIRNGEFISGDKKVSLTRRRKKAIRT